MKEIKYVYEKIIFELIKLVFFLYFDVLSRKKVSHVSSDFRFSKFSKKKKNFSSGN